MQAAKEMNCQKIQVESDCLLAIKEITKKQDTFCEWISILFDILELSADFESCSFYHISRSANVLAHNIAKFQCELGNHRIWRNALPPLTCNPDSFST